jgi:hypothetical protein
MCSHVGNLFEAHKIFRVGTEHCYGLDKLVAVHPFRNSQAESAFTVLLVKQTEFTNYPQALSSVACIHLVIGTSRMLRGSRDKPYPSF